MPPRSPSSLTSVLLFFQWHFCDTAQRRTPKQEQQEKQLASTNIPFKRWMLIPAAALIQMSTGASYSWTVYTVPVERYIGVSEGTGATVLFCLMCGAGVASALCGPLVSRLGPAKCLLISSLISLFGQLMAAVAVYVKSMVLLNVSYGVINGFGLGIAYLVPIAPLFRWYPDRKGLVSFIGVGGSTLGLAFTLVQDSLISVVGVPLTLVILALFTFTMTSFGTWIMRNPPSNYENKSPTSLQSTDQANRDNRSAEEKTDEKDLNGKKAKTEEENLDPGMLDIQETRTDTSDPKVVVVENGIDEKKQQTSGVVQNTHTKPETTVFQCVKTRNYALAYFMTIVINVPVNMIISAKLSDICQQQFGKSRTLGATLFTCLGVSSVLGRISLGALSDHVGRKPVLMLSIFAQGALLALCPFLFRQGVFSVFVVVVVLFGFFNLGSSLIAAFLADLYGTDNVSALFGIINTASPLLNGLVGGAIFSVIFRKQVDIHGADSPKVYDVNMYITSGFCAVCLVTTCFIKTKTPKKT
eukprot:comp15371_c1_seq1/m.12277 comp15371_c1_seq1/g.12277  ORF comp15371_c1_seq1/g.12277 comp15371_c1_seq1/m.12277 type:complete len:527 (-) comp15371_c1_seq1:26-1606(-)